MRRVFLHLCFSLAFFTAYSQGAKDAVKLKPTGISRPKLVVGVVVDQMRWDFLYRYYDRYSATGGFRRLLQQGYSCENTFIPYAPTVTACGHTCIYTGSVPAIHGIVGNNWWDNQLMRDVYCTEDKSVSTVGSTTTAGQMSPANLLTTSIADELKMATNFRSKVVGVAIKDRGGILPAGHSANAAYWYDSKVGKWISSSYYMKELPEWINRYNEKRLIDQYYAQGWSTLYPIDTYTQSTMDQKDYEGNPFGLESKGFPYDFKKFAGTNYSAVNITPFGTTMTLDVAKEALKAESMGADATTDFLAISLSSPDYIGHAFGPNSVEIEDTYLRLDKELGSFLDYLDQKVGKGAYLVFLSADHGVAHIPGFMKENKLPAGTVDDLAWKNDMNKMLAAEFGKDNLIASLMNYQIYLNHGFIDSAKLDENAIEERIIKYLEKRDGVSRAFKTASISSTTLNAHVKDMIANAYFPKRSGDVQIILDPNWIDSGAKGTTHGLWNPYDAHIPLIWYGWNIRPGKTNREIY
ncbi:MAG: alkaline phosphatase family protein, partial [Chitinophagaceae bacterium]|nr:alkaline phosphatase family protein [Chitinophagaceae bacterium]